MRNHNTRRRRRQVNRQTRNKEKIRELKRDDRRDYPLGRKRHRELEIEDEKAKRNEFKRGDSQGQGWISGK